MGLRDALDSAWMVLLANRLRSLLTVLGVVIGVAIVILLVSMGESARQYVSEQVQSMGFGANVLVVHPGRIDPPVSASRLTYEDAQEIQRKVDAVADLMPVVMGTVRVRSGPSSHDTSLWGVTDNYPMLVNYQVQEGRFFDAGEVHRRKSVCVLGCKVKKALFSSFSPVGYTVRVGGRKFLVVGVMQEKGEMVGFDLDDMVITPVTTAQDLLETNRLLELVVWARSASAVSRAREGVTDILQSRHKRSSDFHFHTQGETMNVLRQITGALTTFVAAIAAVSLVVGSLGIMNIMLVSVAERTREIGIRKALGARKHDIFVQFFTEAMSISLLGGAIGVATGTGLSVSVLALMHLPVLVTGWAVVAAAFSSVLVGLVAGVYPAMRAAALDPVSALRYE